MMTTTATTVITTATTMSTVTMTTITMTTTTMTMMIVTTTTTTATIANKDDDNNNDNNGNGDANFKSFLLGNRKFRLCDKKRNLFLMIQQTLLIPLLEISFTGFKITTYYDIDKALLQKIFINAKMSTLKV